MLVSLKMAIESLFFDFFVFDCDFKRKKNWYLKTRLIYNKNMQEEFECEFCKTKFKYKSTLKNHIKTAKFCLNIQNKTEVKNTDFICEYCNTEFRAKRNLNSHIMICKEKDIYDAKTKLSNQYIEEMRLLKENHVEDIRLLKDEINEYNEIMNSRN